MLSKAAAISAAVEAEGQLRQVQANLRDQEEQANDAVKVLACHVSAADAAFVTPLLHAAYCTGSN